MGAFPCGFESHLAYHLNFIMNPQEITISLLIAKHCLQDPEISDRIAFELNLNKEEIESLLVKLQEHFIEPTPNESI